MFRVLFLLFIIVPIIEIAVLMNVGAWLGIGPTIAIVIITAWLGAKNVRQQGIATMSSVQTKLAQGQMPSDEIVAGMMLLVAGVLLVTPGFVTDIFGLSLLVPQVRASLVKAIQSQLIVSQQKKGNVHFHTSQTFEHEVDQSTNPFNETNQPDALDRQGKTLDGEFERKD